MDSMDRISDLPRDILRRILYFLSQEEAVRTSVLSKSWRYTWRTRSSLNFSEATFRGDLHEFITRVDNTLQQYCDQKLCFDEFHLYIPLLHYWDQESVPFLEKWMPRLTTMGVKESRLSILSGYGALDLPSVVFEAESLKHLRVKNLYKKDVEKIALCKHLRSLHLVGVSIDDSIFGKIIAGCPLIETLCIDGKNMRLRTIKMSDLRNLKDFTFTKRVFNGGDELCSIEIDPLSLETIKISAGNIWFRRGADFRDLKDLYLRGVKSSLDNLSFSKFPSLKRLTLSDCDGLKESRIFIDAPNILYFEYQGDFVPSVSFATNSNEWKSVIRIAYVIGIPTTNDGSSLWFLKLNELLKSLSRSKICLSIYKQYPEYEEEEDDDIVQENINPVHDFVCTDKPVLVETLKLGFPLSYFSTLVNGAFSICRPRNIGNYHERWEVQFVGYMWKILMERESGNEDELARLLFRDLEEASLEIKGRYEEEEEDEEEEEEWHKARLSEYLLNHGEKEEEEWRQARLSEYLLSYGENHYRFALKWRATMDCFV